MHTGCVAPPHTQQGTRCWRNTGQLYADTLRNHNLLPKQRPHLTPLPATHKGSFLHGLSGALWACLLVLAIPAGVGGPMCGSGVSLPVTKGPGAVPALRESPLLRGSGLGSGLQEPGKTPLCLLSLVACRVSTTARVWLKWQEDELPGLRGAELGAVLGNSLFAASRSRANATNHTTTH